MKSHELFSCSWKSLKSKQELLPVFLAHIYNAISAQWIPTTQDAESFLLLYNGPLQRNDENEVIRKKKRKSKQQANKEMYYQINEISFELLVETILTLMSYAFLLTELRVLGRLPFTRKTRKFWLENEMVHTIPFETFQKL